MYLTNLWLNSNYCCRGLFIIDKKGIIRQITMNDLPVGRSVDETLRLVQAFQYTDQHGEVCPAGWKPGQDTVSLSHIMFCSLVKLEPRFVTRRELPPIPVIIFKILLLENLYLNICFLVEKSEMGFLVLS